MSKEKSAKAKREHAIMREKIGNDAADIIMEIRNEVHELRRCVSELSVEIKAQNSKLDNLYSAFPERNIEGHRRAHELQIKKIEQMQELTAAIKEKTISGLVWGAIAGLMILLWKGFGAVLVSALKLKGLG